MIIYFSGTGNSKYIAEMMADVLQDEAVNCLDYIQNQIAGDFVSTKPWIFVAPVYVSSPPVLFQQFIETANFAGNDKAYFVMTCAGGISASPLFCEKLCLKKNLKYMGTAGVIMPQNYIAFFKMTETDECKRRYEEAEKKIKVLVNCIGSNQAFETTMVKKGEYFATKLAVKLYYRFFMKTKSFYATKECISCGLCAKKCPRKNIAMKDGKPVWGKECTHCMACINQCPKMAIEYGKNTIGKSRYQCPNYKSGR